MLPKVFRIAESFALSETEPDMLSVAEAEMLSVTDSVA